MIDLTVEKRGRPPIIATPDELESVVRDYIASCSDGKAPSLAGLCLAAGYSSKSALIEVAKRPGFSEPVQKARELIEDWWVGRLSQHQPTGAIFALKNLAGWTDKQEINQTVTINGDGLDGRLAAAIAARTVQGEVIESDE